MNKQLIHIINNTSFYDKGMSGSDRRALEWSRCWIEEGHAVHVFGHACIERRYRSNNVKVRYHALSNYRSINILKNTIYSTIKGISKNSAIRRASVVYSTSDLIADSFPGFMAKLMNRNARWLSGLHLVAPNPMIGFKNTYTSKRVRPSIRNVLYFLLQCFVLGLYKRFSDLVLVSNNQDREFLIRNGFKRNKVLVTYGGVNFNDIPKGKPNKIYDACFVGRFHAQKGMDDLLNVWSDVCKTMKDAKLVIVGEGDMLNDLIRMSRDMGIEKNVVFTGFLDGREKYAVMKSSKVFLFPSTYESFGMSALEAMACGLPVIAYDLPVYGEIFSGGMLKVPVGDRNKFRKELIGLMRNKKGRMELGKEAMKVASKFSWDKTAKDIMERLA